MKNNDTFPNGLEAVVLVGVLYMTEYLLMCALLDMDGMLSLSKQDLWPMVMLLGNAVIFTGLMQFKGLSYRELLHGSSSSIAATTAVLIPAVLLTVPALVMAMELLQGALVGLFPLSGWEERAFSEMASGSLGAIIAVCILAPVLEEMLFRGIILRSFLLQYPRWTAIVGSATLFGFAHMNLYQYVGGLLMGLFLGWLYERSKSLLPCIALHASYNTACAVLELGADGKDDASSAPLLAWWLPSLMFGALGVVILYRALVVSSVRVR